VPGGEEDGTVAAKPAHRTVVRVGIADFGKSSQ
jgi:hypothetical protein